MLRFRHELASTGFDPFLELVGGDGAGTPEGTGLVVPFFPGLRYRFLLAVVDLAAGDAVVGLRQFLDLWAVQLISSGPPPGTLDPYFIFRQPVGGSNGDPFWHFIDGFVTWTLTFESTPPPSHRYNPAEQRSFAYEDSTTPALLFETVDYPAVPVFPGYVGLNAYTPPGMRGVSELTMRDIRYPWQENALQDLWIEAPGSRRARFYADVLQTNPATRTQPFTIPPSGLQLTNPEDQFTTVLFPTTSRYGVVAGAIKVARRKGKA